MFSTAWSLGIRSASGLFEPFARLKSETVERLVLSWELRGGPPQGRPYCRAASFS